MATSTHRKPSAGREFDNERSEEHERMLLLGADQDAFLASVEDPPAPTEKLRTALKHHREVVG